MCLRGTRLLLSISTVNIINAKENEGKGEKRKATKKPGNLPKLCRFQDKCTKGPGQCGYKHVEPHLIEGCNRSLLHCRLLY